MLPAFAGSAIKSTIDESWRPITPGFVFKVATHPAHVFCVTSPPTAIVSDDSEWDENCEISSYVYVFSSVTSIDRSNLYLRACRIQHTRAIVFAIPHCRDVAALHTHAISPFTCSVDCFCSLMKDCFTCTDWRKYPP